jgi:hypothetical protein
MPVGGAISSKWLLADGSNFYRAAFINENSH